MFLATVLLLITPPQPPHDDALATQHPTAKVMVLLRREVALRVVAGKATPADNAELEDSLCWAAGSVSCGGRWKRADDCPRALPPGELGAREGRPSLNLSCQ